MPENELDLLRAARMELLEHIRRGSGVASPEWRTAAADGTAGTGLPPDLWGLVEKVHRHAYRVTDEEMAELRALEEAVEESGKEEAA